eukprot:5155242-Prymnesium_polylepis.2
MGETAERSRADCAPDERSLILGSTISDSERRGGRRTRGGTVGSSALAMAVSVAGAERGAPGDANEGEGVTGHPGAWVVKQLCLERRRGRRLQVHA